MKIFNSDKLKLTPTSKIVPIVKIGCIRQTMILEGRVLPCIVLDTTERPDIEHLILNHNNIDNGHAFSTWLINRQNKNEVLLNLEFDEPWECEFIIAINLIKYGIVIENIMQMGATYIQSNAHGEKIRPGVTPNILIEIPSDSSKPFWDKHYMKQMQKKFRKLGFSKKIAKIKAEEKINSTMSNYFVFDDI